MLKKNKCKNWELNRTVTLELNISLNRGFGEFVTPLVAANVDTVVDRHKETALFMYTNRLIS